VLDRVYRAVAWQRVDQIRYNILILTVAVTLAPQHQTQFSREVNYIIIQVVALPAITLKRHPAKLTQDTFIE
jgi:hypothetical protein